MVFSIEVQETFQLRFKFRYLGNLALGLGQQLQARLLRSVLDVAQLGLEGG